MQVSTDPEVDCREPSYQRPYGSSRISTGARVFRHTNANLNQRTPCRPVDANLPKTDQRRLLSVAEVAEWLSVSPSLVYQLVDSGKLAVFRIGNGRGTIRFLESDIEQYLATCRRGTRQPQSKSTTRPKLKHIRRRPR
ncbi:MAG: helix-turn-helix domain-containing protein [Phycisphaera sp. RhM]|nr:helix-turn-helix domain-containing protein [Phycisphaera sp. RhM]